MLRDSNNKCLFYIDLDNVTSSPHDQSTSEIYNSSSMLIKQTFNSLLNREIEQLEMKVYLLKIGVVQFLVYKYISRYRMVQNQGRCQQALIYTRNFHLLFKMKFAIGQKQPPPQQVKSPYNTNEIVVQIYMNCYIYEPLILVSN